MMMGSMMKLPDGMLRQELLPFLTVHDIVRLDISCMNHEYRPQLLEKINGVILIGDEETSIKTSLFKWLGMRRIYCIKMNILFKVKVCSSDEISSSSSMENDYVDQFRYTQHLIMRGSIKDDMAVFISSHCPCLLSIDIHDCEEPEPQVTDHALQSIAEHCSGLQSLSLCECREISDTGLITISEHCPHLTSLKVDNCRLITDTSLISVKYKNKVIIYILHHHRHHHYICIL